MIYVSTFYIIKNFHLSNKFKLRQYLNKMSVIKIKQATIDKKKVGTYDWFRC